jgi:alkaline phosphatase D
MRYLALFFPALLLAQGPYVAEGLRIGEVTDRSASVRLRLSQQPSQNKGRYQPPQYQGRPPALSAEQDPWLLPGGVPGLPGRLRLWIATRPDFKDAKPGEWLQAEAKNDSVVKTTITGLRPARTYYVGVEIHSKPDKPLASFTTAPEPDRRAPVKFTAACCLTYRSLDHEQGFEIFPSMAKLEPQFTVFAGGSVDYAEDAPLANTIETARYHWQRLYAMPRPLEFFSRTPQYWMKDGPDTLCGGCSPGRDPDWIKPMTFAEGQRIFLEQTPIEGKTYRTFRWGKSVQIWLIEGRDFRSPNDAPDGPAKTLLGAEQKAWLQSSVDQSDADWRIILSPVPWVGPDRPDSADSYATAAFATEARQMRAWAAQKKNLVIIAGGLAWQYHSVDPDTSLHEFGTGPASDARAGGSPGEDKRFHRFHRAAGGFLSVTLQPSSSGSRLVLRHHDVQGAVVYEFAFGS